MLLGSRVPLQTCCAVAQGPTLTVCKSRRQPATAASRITRPPTIQPPTTPTHPQVRLLKHKANQRIRLLMRQEKTLKIRANHIGALARVWICVLKRG